MMKKAIKKFIKDVLFKVIGKLLLSRENANLEINLDLSSQDSLEKFIQLFWIVDYLNIPLLQRKLEKFVCLKLKHHQDDFLQKYFFGCRGKTVIHNKMTSFFKDFFSKIPSEVKDNIMWRYYSYYGRVPLFDMKQSKDTFDLLNKKDILNKFKR